VIGQPPDTCCDDTSSPFSSSPSSSSSLLLLLPKESHRLVPGSQPLLRTRCLIKGARNASRHVHRLVLLAFAKKTLIFDWHSSQYTIHGVFCPALACRWWAFLCDLSMHDDCRLQRHSPFETRPAWWNFATKNALIGQNEHMTTLGMVQAGGATRSRLARIPSKCQVSLPTTKSNLIASPRPRIHSTAPPPSLPWADVIIHPSCRHHRLWAANQTPPTILTTMRTASRNGRLV